MIFLLSAILFSATLANPIPKNEAVNNVSYHYAVDFAGAASACQFCCLKQNGYSAAFVRAYSPAGLGAFDPNSVANIQNAISMNIQSEVYMSPQPKSIKNGEIQAEETFGGLIGGGIAVKTIWIQVVEPAHWNIGTAENIKFIQSAIKGILKLRLQVGIYTSNAYWTAITKNWIGASKYKLWYSQGNGDAPENFDDFKSFGGWNSPAMKQIGRKEHVCGITSVNRDVYTNSDFNPAVLKSDGSVDGGNPTA